MYTLELRARARADIRRLDATIRTQVLYKLDRLCENCDNHPHKALRGRHSGKFRLRVANVYRILYTFDRRTKVIIVHRVGHRSSVY